MSENHQNHTRGKAKSIIIGIAVLLTASTLLLWSWNTLAVDLFQLPEAQFKHAVAALGALMAVAFVFRFPRTRSSGETTHSRRRQGDVS